MVGRQGVGVGVGWGWGGHARGPSSATMCATRWMGSARREDAAARRAPRIEFIAHVSLYAAGGSPLSPWYRLLRVQQAVQLCPRGEELLRKTVVARGASRQQQHARRVARPRESAMYAAAVRFFYGAARVMVRAGCPPFDDGDVPPRSPLAESRTCLRHDAAPRPITAFFHDTFALSAMTRRFAPLLPAACCHR